MATDKMEQDWDVIVVGAGLAGLTAAYHLIKMIPGCKVLVLEAKDRVGGRTFTPQMQGAHGSDSWDLGGQWVSSTQHHALWLLKELGMEHYPQYESGIKLQQIGNDHKIRSYEGDIPALSVPVLLDLLRFEKKMDKLAKTVPYEEPWNAPHADKYDSITFETFIAQNTWTKGAREVIDNAFQVVNGGRGREHSALNYLFYVSSSISNRHLYANKDGGAQQTKLKGGVQNMSLQLAAKVGQSNVLLSEPVISLDQREAGKVKVRTLSGKEFVCKFVISAAPATCTASFQYLPTPPVQRQRLIGHMHVGHLFKFIATYETAFWREKGFSGEIFCTGSKSTVKGCDFGPLLYVCDATTPNDNPALVGFIANPVQWGKIPFEVRKAAILNHLAEFLGPEAKSPVDFMDKDWSLEPYNGGCPVDMMVPGAAKYWNAIRTPFQRIHWAGTETATQWMGYLSGAVQSGLRAADEVASKLSSAQTRSDLVKSLDSLGLSHRQVGTKQGSILWSLGKFTIGAALLGVVVGQAWMNFQWN